MVCTVGRRWVGLSSVAPRKQLNCCNINELRIIRVYCPASALGLDFGVDVTAFRLGSQDFFVEVGKCYYVLGN